MSKNREATDKMAEYEESEKIRKGIYFTKKTFDATKNSSEDSGQTEDGFSPDQTDTILGDVQTFEDSGQTEDGFSPDQTDTILGDVQTVEDSGQTEDGFSPDQTDTILGDVRTFALDGLKITNCIFRRDQVEICYLFDDSCAVHNKDELREQLTDHLKIDEKLIKMTKLRAKPIYKKTTLRPGETATIYCPVKIGAFVHVEGKGNHALMCGHGKSEGNVIRYPNGDRLGEVNVSLLPSQQPLAVCGYRDVALAKLEQQNGYIAQVSSEVHGQLRLVEQPVEAEEGMEVRCFVANGNRGKVDSTKYIRHVEDTGIYWRLIAVKSDANGPIHQMGDSGTLIVEDAPDGGRVKAVGMLVGIDEMRLDDGGGTIRRTSLAVPLTASVKALQDAPYCNGGAIKFLN